MTLARCHTALHAVGASVPECRYRGIHAGSPPCRTRPCWRLAARGKVRCVIVQRLHFQHAAVWMGRTAHFHLIK